MTHQISDLSSRAVSIPEGMIGPDEACRMFGVSQRTWSEWQKQGKVHGVRVGRYRCYSSEEIERLSEEIRRATEPYPDAERPRCYRVPVMSRVHRIEAIIDADSLPLIRGKRLNWTSGSGRSLSSGMLVCQGPMTPLARIIMGVKDPELLVSHLNGDKLDCRKENLIVRTRSEVALARKWEGLEPYSDPLCSSVVRVPVCSDKHKGMEALIDSADLALVQGKRWNWTPSKTNGGSVILAMGGTPKPSLARIILGIDDPEQLVSHVNGDRLDCRRANLAVRTRKQVARARKKTLVKAGRACSSRFKGVSRTASGRKWAASINIGGEWRNLGRFRSEIDAALAYDAAIRELMGDDAGGLNLPDATEVERLRALEPVVEDGPWPPQGMVDIDDACQMFGIASKTWHEWEKKGRISCGKFYPLPDDKPGRCKLYPIEELERLREEISKLGKPYPDPDRPGALRVPLKSYLVDREALIDEMDLPIVEGKNWNWSPRNEDGKTEGTVVLATTGRQLPLHRMIAGVTDPTTRVSFANGDALDCRRANLIVRTLAETAQSSRKMGLVNGRKYTSKFKGVSWDEPRGMWLVQIRKGQLYAHVGRFDDEIAAAKTYDAAARVLFGEHGHLNFPDQPSTEQAMSDARTALDNADNYRRAQRLRQRDVERQLQRAMNEKPVVETRNDSAMISQETARQLFDVAPCVWQRWQGFAWLPETVMVDGTAMYRLVEIELRLLRCGIVALPYPDPQQPGVYRVPLSGETANGREALIDSDAVSLVQTRRWRFAASDKGRGGEVQTMIPSENIRLHYVVMGIIANADDFHIGHRNDDPLDCRRSNLVVRTLTDTAANKRKQATFCGRPCTSRFKGVCMPKKSTHWVATIKKDRVAHRLGTFDDEIAAAQAYDEAARELFGEHARLNLPSDGERGSCHQSLVHRFAA